MRFAQRDVLVVLLAAAVGCSSRGVEGPATVPVKGQVVFTKNGNLKPLVDRQASIQFESVEQPGVKAIGVILDDGTFTLSTVLPDGTKKGAVPGKHRVRLFLDDAASQFVAPKFVRFETSGIAADIPRDEVAGESNVIVVNIWR